MKQTFALIVAFIFKAAGLCATNGATGGATENVLTWYGMTDADKTLVMQMNSDAHAQGHGQNMMGFYVKLVNRDKEKAELPEAINSVGKRVKEEPSLKNNLYMQVYNLLTLIQGKYDDQNPLHHPNIADALSEVKKLTDSYRRYTSGTIFNVLGDLFYHEISFPKTLAYIPSNIALALEGGMTIPISQSYAQALEVLQGRPYLKGTKEVHGGIFGSDGNKQSGFDSKKNLKDKLAFLLTKLNTRSKRSDATIKLALDNIGNIGASSSCESYRPQVHPHNVTLQEAIDFVNGLLGDIQTTPEGGTSYTAKDIYQRLFKGIENLNALLQTRVQGGWTDQPNIGAIISHL